MFKRPRHQLVSCVLSALSPDFLRDNRCYFGGGTRIVMELNEYRESLDIDLLCADLVGYRNIRSQISGHSLGSILTTPLSLAREIRADRYGLRTFFDIEGEKVKFEIVFEGRITLTDQDLPELPIPCLDQMSCFAEKLLANADRWADRSVLSRDIIDIAFMASHWGNIPAKALAIAENAYGACIIKNLKNAVALVQSDVSYLDRCIDLMAVTDSE
jgi:Nucleotidyl transferase AbiEii toxin, Type IV TA system